MVSERRLRRLTTTAHNRAGQDFVFVEGWWRCSIFGETYLSKFDAGTEIRQKILPLEPGNKAGPRA